MRLVIDGRRLSAGRTGVGRYLEGLLEEWGATGPPRPETVVVLKDRSGLDRVPGAEGLRAVVVGERWPGLAWERWGLGRVLRRGDLLFAPTNLVPANWRGRTVLVMFDALQEVVPDGFPWHVRIRFGGRYRRAARRAERVLVPSEATARDVRRIYGVPAHRLRVIPPGIGPEFRPLSRDSVEVVEARRTLGLKGDPFFLFVGKRSRRRNVPAILAAFARHRAQHPTHRLVFVGPDPPGADLGPLAPERGLVVAGHVAEPVLVGLMADAVALLYPS